MVCAACLLAACRPEPTPAVEAEAYSAWGRVYTLAQSVQLEAPALYPHRDRIDTVWIDAGQSRYLMRSLLPGDAGLTSAAQSPITTVYPQEPHLAPAELNHNHLLWRDINRDQPDAGAYLAAAILRPDGTLERGPTRIADSPVYHYTAQSSGDNGVWAVWSSGLPAAPTLYAVFIDNIGRPRPVIDLRVEGDWPVLVNTDTGEMALLWLADQQVYAALLAGDGLRQITPLTAAVDLQPGDLLLSFEVALHADDIYLVWNVQRASGQVETWLAANAGLPQRLSIVVRDGEPFETGFNGGAAVRASQIEVVQEAEAGTGDAVRWASPLPGASGMLAAQVGDTLGVLYLRGGMAAAFQPVVTLDAPGLLGLPTLRTDVNRHLTLAWSQPTPDGLAQLKLTTTRR